MEQDNKKVKQITETIQHTANDFKSLWENIPEISCEISVQFEKIYHIEVTIESVTFLKIVNNI